MFIISKPNWSSFINFFKKYAVGSKPNTTIVALNETNLTQLKSVKSIKELKAAIHNTR